MMKLAPTAQDLCGFWQSGAVAAAHPSSSSSAFAQWHGAAIRAVAAAFTPIQQQQQLQLCCRT
jgi:hypothetical protein